MHILQNLDLLFRFGIVSATRDVFYFFVFEFVLLDWFQDRHYLLYYSSPHLWSYKTHHYPYQLLRFIYLQNWLWRKICGFIDLQRYSLTIWLTNQGQKIVLLSYLDAGARCMIVGWSTTLNSWQSAFSFDLCLVIRCVCIVFRLESLSFSSFFRL